MTKIKTDSSQSLSEQQLLTLLCCGYNSGTSLTWCLLLLLSHSENVGMAV